MKLPDPLVMPTAVLLISLANLIKKPPAWGMAIDQIRTMQHDINFDGSKAERELGLTYTPLRTAIEDMIASY
ncbi:MAG: hypothetical protein SVY53_07540 [Chloroflexota bacterium]|nr:hypothetical protein [Chloroflexota bacterium]